MRAWAVDSRVAQVGRHLMHLLPAIWLGVLLCIALLATPAPFATLSQPDAGRVVAHVFAREAPLALLLGVACLISARRRASVAAEAGRGSAFSLDMGLALATLACTVVGYYALQPMMSLAKAGQGTWSFAQLHAISLGFFLVKMFLVAALAWRSRTL